MKEFTHTITNEIGLHARPAGNLVKLVKTFSSSVTVEKEGKAPVSARALMKVMGLGAMKGDTVKLVIEGEDEDAAFESIQKYMQENL